MSLLDDLMVYEVDVQDGLKRFANNIKLYEKMVKKFPAAAAKIPVLPYFESGDIETALANAHTLKGMTGNLSLTPLYEAYTEIVSLLREGKPEPAKKMLKDILPTQENIVACIESYS